MLKGFSELTLSLRGRFGKKKKSEREKKKVNFRCQRKFSQFFFVVVSVPGWVYIYFLVFFFSSFFSLFLFLLSPFSYCRRNLTPFYLQERRWIEELTDTWSQSCVFLTNTHVKQGWGVTLIVVKEQSEKEWGDCHLLAHRNFISAIRFEVWVKGSNCFNGVALCVARFEGIHVCLFFQLF